MNIDAAIDYLSFVAERHRVWERRQAGCQQPWTTNPVLAHHKFTNVFRVLDPGSQFVLTDLLPDTEPEEFLLRCFLYRHTGRVDAWQWLGKTVGYPKNAFDLEAVLAAWKEWRRQGQSVFTGAYLVYPQSSTPGTDKLESIIDLAYRLFSGTMAQVFLMPGSQRDKFEVLRRNKGVADFMSMQILTDFGYSTEFRENALVVAGPGARKGAAALEMRPEHAIRWAHELMNENPGPRLGDRGPSLMDIQNTLCEFGKYVRFASKPVPSGAYKPAHPGAQLPPVLPPKW